MRNKVKERNELRRRFEEISFVGIINNQKKMLVILETLRRLIEPCIPRTHRLLCIKNALRIFSLGVPGPCFMDTPSCEKCPTVTGSHCIINTVDSESLQKAEGLSNQEVLNGLTGFIPWSAGELEYLEDSEKLLTILKETGIDKELEHVLLDL